MNQEQAVDYWGKMQEQEKMFPQAHIYTNIKNQGVDMEKLAQTNPYLFQMFTRIFSGVETPETVQTWKNYQQAYNELQAQGLLNFSSKREEVIQAKIDEFVKKVDGPCLVPVEELEEVITEKKRKGVVSVQVDFNDYMDLLENYYDFNHRDFFKKFENAVLDYEKLFNLTPEQMKYHSNLAPSQDLLSAKMSVLYDLREQYEGMPYADFWHYLMDHDFMDVSNGSVQTLWFDNEAEDEDEEDDGIVIPSILFAKMREVMFKEISQYSYYKNEKPSEMEFYISW